VPPGHYRLYLRLHNLFWDVVLVILLATLPMCFLAGCKKKAQSVNAKSPDFFTEEQQIQLTKFANEEIYQSNQLFTYPLSENDYDEFAEDPNEDEYDEYEEEPGYDSNEPNNEQPDDEEEYYDDEPNDYPDDEPNDRWYQDYPAKITGPGLLNLTVPLCVVAYQPVLQD
jgi:hypothetical protein